MEKRSVVEILYEEKTKELSEFVLQFRKIVGTKNCSKIITLIGEYGDLRQELGEMFAQSFKAITRD